MMPFTDVIPLDIHDVKLVRPPKFRDDRGVFCEIYNRDALSAGGISVDFVQDNCSLSLSAGTVRGLHFQANPKAQAKLVTVLRGRVHDVVVDCRVGSPTYGQHAVIELSSEEWEPLCVPIGFAHGFCSLEADTVVHYKVSAPYDREYEGGILWNDPDLKIAWPVAPEQVILSDKDKQLPRLRHLAALFSYTGT